jgi:RNA polymerase sigma-70 factor (ECF subfamily)
MLLADPAGAEDAVHHVFAALAVRRRDDIDSIGGYLRQAVRNACYSTLRERVAKPHQSLDTTVPLEARGADADPAERIALESALGRLPPEQREVVHLKVFEGLTFQEIADLASESVNTVASRYRYAVDKLRVELGGRR